MKIHLYYVYVLTNINHTVLYTGVTNDLVRRTFEHKKKIVKGFTFKYNVDKLIYFEQFDFIDLAIAREKQIKGYSRAKKIVLVNKFNPQWNDLYDNGKIEIPRSARNNKSAFNNGIPRSARNDSVRCVGMSGARSAPDIPPKKRIVIPSVARNLLTLPRNA